MWFNQYRFERRNGKRWQHVRKVSVPDSLLASLIINYLAMITGAEWRVMSGDREVCRSQSKEKP